MCMWKGTFAVLGLWLVEEGGQWSRSASTLARAMSLYISCTLKVRFH